MMQLWWSTLLLCLSANAESVVWQESGKKVTFKCSSSGCPRSIEGYDGMFLYLYQDDKEGEEVLYYYSDPESADKISPRVRYTDRIQIKGSLQNHTITISRLTVDDSGVYQCVYTRLPHEVRCSKYILFIRGAAPCPTSVEAPCAPSCEKKPPFLLIVIAACTITILITVIFILIITPRVKRWMVSRGTTAAGALHVPSDNVYEVMTKNSLCPP